MSERWARRNKLTQKIGGQRKQLILRLDVSVDTSYLHHIILLSIH